MAQNGRLPLSTLTEVQPGVYLDATTARHWLGMVATAAGAGIRLWITAGGGYRDIDAQAALKAAGSASGISVAAVGAQPHGLGTRLDVGSLGSRYGAAGISREKWLHAHAREFGFVFEFGSRDPNHLAFVGGATASVPAPSPEKKAIPDMSQPLRYQHAKNANRVALAGFLGAPGPGNWDEYLRDDAKDGGRAPHEFSLYGPPRIVDDVEWERLKKLYTTPAAAGELTLSDAAIAKLAKANAEAFFAEQKKAGN